MEKLHNEKSGVTHTELNEEEEPPSTKCFTSEEQILREFIQDRLDRDKTTLSLHSLEFAKQYFPEATEKDWTNWHWQLKNSVQTIDQLSRFIHLTDNEIRPAMEINNTLPIRITPYYLSLLEQDNPEQGLRKSVVPVFDEFIASPGEASDP
ncbi:MAG: hypothetical protein ABSE72_10030, partial [Bacteroidales bacterium]